MKCASEIREGRGTEVAFEDFLNLGVSRSGRSADFVSRFLWTAVTSGKERQQAD